MKRVSSKVERTGDNVVVSGLFKTKWRKPGTLKVIAEETDYPIESTVMEGDIKEVQGALYSLAEVAWEMGWRPAGLSVLIDHVIKNFKLPKQE